MTGPTTDPRYLTDSAGNRVGVVLNMETHRQMLDDLEEIEAARAYDEGKAALKRKVLFPLSRQSWSWTLA